MQQTRASLEENGTELRLCEECDPPLIGTGKPHTAMDQSESIITSADLFNVQRPLLTNEQAQGNLLQNRKERVENLIGDDQVIKLCTDVEKFSLFYGHVVCREYTLPRDGESSKPKDWIRGSTKIGLVLEMATSYHQGKHGVEMRTESLSKDGSHSWIRVLDGLKKFVRET